MAISRDKKPAPKAAAKKPAAKPAPKAAAKNETPLGKYSRELKGMTKDLG